MGFQNVGRIIDEGLDWYMSLPDWIVFSITFLVLLGIYFGFKYYYQNK